MALSMPGSTACYCAALSSEIRAKFPSKTRDVIGFKSLTKLLLQLHIEEGKTENGKMYIRVRKFLGFFFLIALEKELLLFEIHYFPAVFAALTDQLQLFPYCLHRNYRCA